MFRPRAFFRPLDAVLALLLTGASAWGFLAFRFSEGTRALVYVGDRKYGWYELAGPRHEVIIPTAIGPVGLEIGDGAARVISSPCRNKICVRTGAVRRGHSEIVCMPAHLLIVIAGDEPGRKNGEGLDAITF